MTVPEWIERIGRTVFESPFAGNGTTDVPELAEIRLVMIDAVRAKCQRLSGRQVFPFNTVSVLVRGVSETDASIWRSSFLQLMFERELRAGLVKAKIRFPDDLTVQVRSTQEFPVAPQQWIEVGVATRPRTATAHRRAPRLVLMQGTANVVELAIEKPRTNIGRTVDVHRSDGPSRRNDMAFSDDSPVNRTVSREHAHILFLKSRGEYRIFNDRVYADGNCGLWILRDGLSRAVHRDDRGVRLLHGDEIHFGSAVVRFVTK
jgi:hypothetical protein